MLEREKQVLFDGDRLESEGCGLVDERQVRVRLDEPRHQRGAAAGDRVLPLSDWQCAG